MSLRILMVDDDRELCSEVSEILNEEGYSVDIATHGAQGKNFIDRQDYDVILLDFKMPGFNGIELLKRIKEKNNKSRVFLISGKPLLDKIISNLKPSYSVDAVFSKPFDVESLLAKLKEFS